MTQDRRPAAIMFSDIVGFTFLMGRDEGHGLSILEHNRTLHRECVSAHNGRLVKEIGDGMLSWFPTAADAVHCAIAMQERMQSQDYKLRIGIHFGEVVLREGDVYGNTVNIANRIEGLANPGAVFVTEQVVESARDVGDTGFLFLGEQMLKHVESQMRIFGLEHPHLARPQLRMFLNDSIDQEIQQYHLVEKLAVGGMGIIYKALDTKLQRTVVLKFLSPHLNNDKQARERFLKEARSAAALQHPNICTIYEIDETEEGRYFIAMEFIEGPTLRDRLEAERAIAPATALDLAIQLAEALRHAHEAGIVHRDIKPVNIKVTPEGTVKMLDFGLALSGDLKAFKRGVRVGTLAYMSPEQTRGEALDHRSDIWSFGVVLYEMLTGVRPFGGEYDHQTVHDIISEPPANWPEDDRPIPAGLRNIVEWCLEKDPAYRVQTAAGLLAALRREQRKLEQASSEEGAGVAAPRRFMHLLAGRPWLLPLLILLALALGGTIGSAFKPESAGEEVAANLPREMTLFTGRGNLSLFPAWSPDGEWVIYVSDEGGSMDIWKKPLSGGQAVQLTRGPANEIEPAWSPDGDKIAYHSDGERPGIMIIPADGGSTFQLTDFGGSPAWSPDSRRIAFSAYGNVYLVSANGGEPEMLVEGTSANPRPIWAANGRRLLFWHRTLGDIHVINADGGESTPLGLAPAGQEVGSLSLNRRGDHLLFTMGAFGGSKDLFEVPIDTATGQAMGSPRHLTMTPTDDIGAAYSPGGDYIAFTSRTVERHLYELPVDPQTGLAAGPPRQITFDGRLNYYPEMSADGRRVVWTSHRSGQGNLYCSLLSGEELEKVTSNWDPGGREISGRFDSEGQQVFFASTQGGSYQLWRVPSVGSVALQITETQNPRRDVHPSLSPDNGALAFYSNRSGSWDIWRLDLQNGAEPRQLTDWPGNELYPVWSPGGQEVAFVTDRSGNADIWSQPIDGGEAYPLVESPAEERWCAWSRDRRWFYFVSNRDGAYNVWRMPAAGGEAEPVTSFNDPAFGLTENSIYTKFAVGPRQLILSLESRRGDIYVLRR